MQDVIEGDELDLLCLWYDDLVKQDKRRQAREAAEAAHAARIAERNKPEPRRTRAEAEQLFAQYYRRPFAVEVRTRRGFDARASQVRSGMV